MQKTRYYIRRDNSYEEVTDEAYHAYINSRVKEICVYSMRINNSVLEVPKDKYEEFYKEKSRDLYLLRMAIEYQELSYNKLDTDEMLGIDMIPDESIQVEEDAIRNILIDKLHDCIKQLPEDDQEFISMAYFGEKSERDLARLYGISQPAIHKRKMKIIFQLKKLLEV